MASDTSIFKDRDATTEEEASKHVGFRNTDLSLFLRNRQESEAEPPADQPEKTKVTHCDDPGLLPGIGLLAIPGVGPLLAAAALITHEHDVTEKKEKPDEPSDEAFGITEENVRHKSNKTEDDA